ncbi:uncharacterized protein LOC131207053 [Anopheles bellator]|uniref:uncharacterized protein LOC131207053 n=1 Tax=Anopheles bellator TaxID=139047 RepID=UPI0026499CD9|nr:uncharacterized protein LOC131207053 [Anopheles bellator]
MQDPSGWLDARHFEKALAQHTADRDLQVEDVQLALHSDPSQQYASTIYRARVCYRSRGKSETAKLIVKLVASKVHSLANESPYETELGVYRDAIAPMEAALSKSGSTGKFGPRLIFAASEPRPHLILEDLTNQQYVAGSGLLAADTAVLVLTKLAQFHAASFSQQQASMRKPTDKQQNELFKPKTLEGMNFLVECFGIFIEQLSAWEGYAHYAKRFHSLRETFFEWGIQIYNAQDAEYRFKVLNHGDFHYSNVLLKLNSGDAPNDVLFVDYQLSCWTTVAVDLLYFLYLVCDHETRQTKRQQLLQLYHREFSETLATLGFMGKAPTLLDLNMDLVRAGFLEVVLVVCFVPFLFADYGHAVSVYGTDETDAHAYRRKLYNHPEYRVLLRELLPRFLHQGFLE